MVLPALIGQLQSATNNTGNSPAFIMIDLCTNGLGDSVGNFDQPRMEPDVFDIGLDIDADGTIDRWLSQEGATWFGGGNSDAIFPDAFRRIYFFQLDEYVGRQAKIRFVDKSEIYYMAINAVRVCGADGEIVGNAIKNGFFEAENGLDGWNVIESSLDDVNKLIVSNGTPGSDEEYVNYSGRLLSTMTDPLSLDFTEQAVVESDAFTIPQVTSFIFGNMSGGVSEFVNIPEALFSDNQSGVYIDLGTMDSDPDGAFDPANDIALRGQWGGAPGAGRNDFFSVFINTSGLEGRRAQVVAFDHSDNYHVALDAIRMNWDWQEAIIKNGGFDQGVPTPESHPDATLWFQENGSELPYTEHPSGSIPGWKVLMREDATGNAFFFDSNARRDHMTGRTFVGTGGGNLAYTGVEIRSDVFTIQPIPNASESVFVQFASAQGTDRERYSDDGSERAFGRIQLIVDVNGNGSFDDAEDFHYVQRNQSMAPNYSNSGRDLWHHPEYRFYIQPEHQSKMAIFRGEDNFGPFKASWGWLCIDDLFVWDGKSAELAFPNSDFELGSLENWVPVIQGGAGFNSWLSGSRESVEAGTATHSVMNNRSVDIDGKFAADTAARETGGGDGGIGSLTSIPFQLPSLTTGGIQSIAIASEKVVIEFSGTLKAADSIVGPFTPVPGASSPYEVTPDSSQKFYSAE